MSDSTDKITSRKSKLDKPKKPYKKFPLGPATCGYWQKRINGKIHYFGAWGKRVNGELVQLPDGGAWKEALAKYQAQSVALHAGRTPRLRSDEDLTLMSLCNRFLSAKKQSQKAGELGRRMFEDYQATTDLIIAQFGKERVVDDLASDDFESLRTVMAQRWGPTRLGNEISRVKTVFKYGYDAGLINQPMRFGPQFKRPGKNVLRRHRAANGKKLLEAEEIQKLLAVAPTQLKAMILLGINCGFGNHDCAALPISAIDLDRAWVDYPRPKTGVERSCTLWSETVDALREVLTERPEPRYETVNDLVFLRRNGRSWVTNERANSISINCAALMKKVGVYRSGTSFYVLRHTFETIAGGSKDQVAVNHVMGHSDGSMAATYRERIDDSRLQAVVDHVHDWLFRTPNNGASAQPESTADTKNAETVTDQSDDQPATLKLFAG